MTLDTSIPGFPRIDDWPTLPVYPVTVAEFSRYRDGGIQGGTVFAVLVDADQQRYPICFDRFLGRLCFGATHTSDDNVAFVRAGSPLEHSIVAIFEAFVTNNPSHVWRKDILEQMNLIQHWSSTGEK